MAKLSFSNLELAQHSFLLLRRASSQATPSDAIDYMEIIIGELERNTEEATGYLPSAVAQSHWETMARYYAVWQYLSVSPEDGRAAETARQNYEEARRKWFRAASVESNYDHFNDFNNRRRMQFMQPTVSDDEESSENTFRWDDNNISQTEDLFSKPPVVDDITTSVTAEAATSVFDPSTDASDPESLLDLTSVTILGGPLNGSATVNSTTGVITYTSNAGSGTDVIVAQLSDKSAKYAQFKIDITYS
jgi:hypothetical protein